ncbi:MAG: cysteine desulfurase [Planctomycetes bacterium]|nr:cysteine desulfurase [Planctomycetota bacterium]
MIDLDANATTPPLPEVVQAVRQALEQEWANPSSIHRGGQAARRVVELARAEVAALLGCTERELVFTSGGTEAADLAIRGSLQATGRSMVVTSPLEHAAVRDLARRLEAQGAARIIWLQHDARGRVSVAHLERILAEHAGEIAVVSVMAANNETGTIQPVAELARACRQAGVSFHTDATQWVGKMPTDMASLGVDLLSCSAHKLHGPKGVGALAIRRGTPLEAVLAGGPQERERRAGTENVPGIAGFAAAARLARTWLAENGGAPAAALRDLLERLVREARPEAQVNAAEGPRLWNTASVAFPGLEAEAILLALSERGVFASAGAACSSGSLEPSPVLLALGLPERVAHGTVRFSLSRGTTETEVREAAGRIEAAVQAVQRSSTHALGH